MSSPMRRRRSTSLGYVVGIGLTLALFQHMASGLRHFVLDTGAGYRAEDATSSVAIADDGRLDRR